MRKRNLANSGNSRPRCSRSRRIAAGLIVLGLAAVAAVFGLSARESVDLGFWFGVCGFKQRFDLPCPGCGWTHAVEAFVAGRFLEAFRVQPAAAFFCVVGVAAGFYALLIALFGIDFGFPKRLIQAIGPKPLVWGAILVFLAGWAVTLVRALMHGDGI